MRIRRHHRLITLLPISIFFLIAIRGTTREPEKAVSPRGHLLIVGGGRTPEEVTRRFIELAGGADAARIAILSMAHDTPAFAELDAAEFKRAGASTTDVFTLTREQALDPASAKRFDDYTAIWISGGQQSRLKEILKGTPAADAILARYRAGAVVGGTSAGAAAVSRLMIVGGERRPSARPTDDTGTYETVERDNVLTVEGLGLLEEAVVDQHFLRRRRHNRLLSVVLEHPETIGVGLDESAALHVHPDEKWEILGDGQVVVIDARASRVTEKRDGAVLGAGGVSVHVLPPGSTFEPRNGKFSLP